MKKNFMCFIYVYFWNRKMDNPVLHKRKTLHVSLRN